MIQMGHNSGNWNTPMNIPCPEWYVSPSTPFPGVATSLWLPVRLIFDNRNSLTFEGMKYVPRAPTRKLMHPWTKNKACATTPMVYQHFLHHFRHHLMARNSGEKSTGFGLHTYHSAKRPQWKPSAHTSRPGSPGSKYNWLLGFGRFGMQPHLSCRMPNLCGRYLPRWGFLPHYIPSGYLT